MKQNSIPNLKKVGNDPERRAKFASHKCEKTPFKREIQNRKKQPEPHQAWVKYG